MAARDDLEFFTNVRMDTPKDSRSFFFGDSFTSCSLLHAELKDCMEDVRLLHFPLHKGKWISDFCREKIMLN